ncbi:NAD(P)/FAD-dependent oxidoreductase [Brachybacterium sp. YJGR34]|uniref:NAD(P)/FAD-dependent oxidoreductase n=1 Tax=Brachybacterium sp. YJGR34 TaxID=2059911 RepID=UPI000E0B63C9|nr:FAD-dependent oxidoreductase [Brachybacterium sp. YJGR34]
MLVSSRPDRDGPAGAHRADVLIVGASLAGLSTAEALRAEGFSGSIALLGEEGDPPYGRPPLSKQVLEGTWEPDRAALRTAEDVRALDLELLTARALGLDVRCGTVCTTAGTWRYGRLVIATGARAVRPADMTGAERVMVLRTLEDAVRLRAALAESRTVAVLGSGVLASEIASAARGAGRRVVLLGRSGRLGIGSPGLCLHDRLSELHRRHGVTLRLAAPVRGMAPDGRAGMRIVLDRGEELRSDLVVAALGAVPATEWLHGSGLDLTDGVLCDAQGRAAPGIFAVGDVARWEDAARGPARRIGHQSAAIDQARRVARTMCGHAPEPPPLPFFWSRIHGTGIQVYGDFPGEARLRPIEEDGDRAVLASMHARTGRVHGVVGWNAPKSFRRARQLVDRDRRPIARE